MQNIVLRMIFLSVFFQSSSLFAFDILSSGWGTSHEMTSVNGDLYIIDKSDDKLKKVNPLTGDIISIVNSVVWSESSSKPVRMTSLGGFIYIIQNQAIHKIDPTNGSYTYGPGIWWGTNIELTSLGSYLYVIQNSVLHQVSPTTLTYTQYYTNTYWSEYTNRPVEMIGANGKLYIINNAVLHEVDPNSGAFDQLTGQIWTGNVKLAAHSDWLFILQNDTLHEVDINHRDSNGNITFTWDKNVNYMTSPSINGIMSLVFIEGGAAYDKILALHSGTLSSTYSNFCDYLQDQVDATMGGGSATNWAVVTIPPGEFYCGASVANFNNGTVNYDYWKGLLLENVQFLKLKGNGSNSTVLRIRKGDRAGVNAIQLGNNLNGIEISDFTILGSTPASFPDASSFGSGEGAFYWFHRAIGTETKVLNLSVDTPGDGSINCVYCKWPNDEANGPGQNPNKTSSNIQNLYIHNMKIEKTGLGIDVMGHVSRGVGITDSFNNIFISDNVFKNIGPYRDGGGLGYGVRIADLGGKQYVLENEFYDVARHSIYKGGGDGQTLIRGNLVLRNGPQVAIPLSRSNNITSAFNILVKGANNRLMSIEDGSDQGLGIGWDSQENPLTLSNINVVGNHFHGFNSIINSISPAIELYSSTKPKYWGQGDPTTVADCNEPYTYMNNILQLLSPTGPNEQYSSVQLVANNCNMNCITHRNLTFENSYGCTKTSTVDDVSSFNYPSTYLWGVSAFAKPIKSSAAKVIFETTGTPQFIYRNWGLLVMMNGAMHVVSDPNWFLSEPDAWSYNWDYVVNGGATKDIAASSTYAYWLASDGSNYRLYRSPLTNLTNYEVLKYSNNSLVSFAGDGNINIHYDGSSAKILINDYSNTIMVDESNFVGYTTIGPSKNSAINNWVQSIAGKIVEVQCSSSNTSCTSTLE